MKTPRKVHVVGEKFPAVGLPSQYHDMFTTGGWEVSDFKSADLVQFTGGSDVTPSLYGQERHEKTSCNPARDEFETVLFNLAVKTGKAIAGICRGGQFVNVMNGGKMFQHVDRHAIHGTHECRDLFTGDTFAVTSTHHQMMDPGDGAAIIGIGRESTFKETMKGSTIFAYISVEEADVEICFYPLTNSFCFQPHPEYYGQDVLAERYFDYIETYLFPKAAA